MPRETQVQQPDAEHPNGFARLADDLYRQGYSIASNILPAALLQALYSQVVQTDSRLFSPAGIGREQDHSLDSSVRRDQVCWIDGSSSAGQAWLDWAAELQTYLNRRLLLGLFSFESHFAHYPPGAFYKTHTDAFKGETNRVLSLVLYLNPDWREGDGGEMLLYPAAAEPVRVAPRLGTLATFLSEDFPHEVLPTRTDRYSIAGWFRVNTSNTRRVDPPT